MHTLRTIARILVGALLLVSGHLTLAAGPAAAAEPPPLPVPHPDYTLTGDVSLCGTFELGSLTIPSGRTLRVATAADPTVVLPVREGATPRASCRGEDVGRLTLLVHRLVNHGTMDATGTQITATQPPATGSAPTGTGGGGHGGAGGAGWDGAGGSAYPWPDRDEAFPGAPGGGSVPGSGGGAITVRTRPQAVRATPGSPTITATPGAIISTGPIRANGTSGGPGTLCAEEMGQMVPALGGGGAGGGILLEAQRVELSGAVEAAGGWGGLGDLGAGGGGGGGRVVLRGTAYSLTGAFGVNVAGGPGGPNCIGAEGIDGGAGVDTKVIMAASQTAVSTTPSPSVAGQTVTIEAVVTGGSIIPTGTVELAYGGGVLGTATLDATGTATITTTALPVGSHTIVATYLGGNYAASLGTTDHTVVVPDETLPTITATVTPASPDGAAGWYDTAPTVSFTCADAGSGVASCSGPTTLSSSATAQSVTGTATDNAGNMASTTVSGLKVDLAPPTITATVTPATPDGAAGWYDTAPTVSFTCADPHSGIASCTGPTTLGSSANPQSVTGTATDVAGHTTSITVSNLEVDTVGPTITGAVAPSAPNGTGGWYRTAPTVSFTCTDSASGVATCTGPTTLGSAATPQSVTGTATDVAGHRASTTVSGVKVDLVPPTVTCAAAPTFTVGQAGSVSATVSDAHSGPAATSVSTPASTSSAGSFTASLTGTDVAGHRTTVSCPYSVQKQATVLDAHPVLVQLRPSVSVSLPLSARLTTTDGSAVAGQTVAFSVRGRVLCTATTDSTGWARCGSLLALAAAVTNGGFTATFGGSAAYSGSSDSAGLLG